MDSSRNSPLDDPLDQYKDLKGRSARKAPFPFAICEGAFLVESALHEALEGRLQIRSILVSKSRRSDWVERIPSGTEFLVLPDADLEDLLGFKFHRGVLACVDPPAESPLSEFLACNRLLVLPRIYQEENLGLLIRSAAALGMDGALLGGGVSPWARRTVRTSMGGVFRLPLWRLEDPGSLLDAWQGAGGEVVAAALGPGCEDARCWRPSFRTALILGPEDRGLDDTWIARTHRRLAIPMARGMDSLNVAAAGAILMDRICGQS